MSNNKITQPPASEQPQLTLKPLTQETSEVFRIDPIGRIFWKQREVETDDELRAAMLEIRDALVKSVPPPVSDTEKRPMNCGTGHCSCIECVAEPVLEPSDEEIVKFAHRLCCTYKHHTEAWQCRYSFGVYALIDFARAVLAARGAR